MILKYDLRVTIYEFVKFVLEISLISSSNMCVQSWLNRESSGSPTVRAISVQSAY